MRAEWTTPGDRPAPLPHWSQASDPVVEGPPEPRQGAAAGAQARSGATAQEAEPCLLEELGVPGLQLPEVLVEPQGHATRLQPMRARQQALAHLEGPRIGIGRIDEGESLATQFADPRDVAGEHPERVAAMRRALADWRADVR